MPVVSGGGHAQGPREAPAPLGQVEAGDDRVQVGAPAGQPVRRVGHDGTVAGHDPQQLGRGRAPRQPDAGADRRAQAGPVPPGAAGSADGAAAAPGAPAAVTRSTSGRMSIRQPVSRAASRAFWPSLPMASDSW